MSNRINSLVAAVLLGSAILPLHAATMDTFTLTSGTDVATFSLPASPTPNSTLPNSVFFLDGISVVVDGVSTTATIIFYNSGQYGGGLDINNGTDLIDQKGPLLFSNMVTDPTFYPGTYALSLYTLPSFPFTGVGVYQENFSLVIAPASTPAPEPSTLALLGTGVLGIIGAVRRRLNPQR